METHIVETTKMANLVDSESTLGQLVAFIKGNSQMGFEMALVGGRKRQTMCTKVNGRMIEDAETEPTFTLMEWFIRELF